MFLLRMRNRSDGKTVTERREFSSSPEVRAVGRTCLLSSLIDDVRGDRAHVPGRGSSGHACSRVTRTGTLRHDAHDVAHGKGDRSRRRLARGRRGNGRAGALTWLSV